MALSQILPSLFLSGADGAENTLLVSRNGITLIVNATLFHMAPPPPGVEVLRVPVSDLPSARIDHHFDRVAERIHGNREGKTLVHCAAGMSRSPALVMAYLMRFRGASLRQAHALVRDKRPHIRLNRGFWEQLLSYERRLYGNNSVRLANEEEGGGSITMTRPLTGNASMTAQSIIKTRPLTGNAPMTAQSITKTRPLTVNAPMAAQSITKTRPVTGNAPMTAQSLTKTHPLSRSRGLTAPLSASSTPQLRRAEFKDRKCLSQIPKSPLMSRRTTTVHSGNGAHHGLTRQ